MSGRAGALGHREVFGAAQEISTYATRRDALDAGPIWPPWCLLKSGRSWRFRTLGFSLPDLTITGEAGPRAAWGGVLDVSVYLQNIGASTTTEPLSQAPATQAPIRRIALRLDQHGGCARLGRRRPALAQPKVLEGGGHARDDSRRRRSRRTVVEQLTEAFTLPSRPPGFAGAGGKFYVWFVANATNAVPRKSTRANNISKPVAVMVTGSGLARIAGDRPGRPQQPAPGRHDHPRDPDRELRHGRSECARAGHGGPGGLGHPQLHSG